MSMLISQDIRRSQGVGQAPTRPAASTADVASANVPRAGSGIVVDREALASFDQQRERTRYDQPAQKQLRAIALYQQTAQQSQREQLQQLLSIDLIA